MSTQQGEPNMESFLERLAALEQANTRLSEELAALRAARSAPSVQATVERQVDLPQEVKDAKAVGEALESALILAPGPQGPAAFTSSDGTTPAVSATGNPSIGVFASGTSGADSSGNVVSGYGVYAKGTSGKDSNGNVVPGFGVYGSSDNGTGVFGVSSSGPGVYANSNTGPSIHAVGSGASLTQATVFAEGSSGTAIYGHATSFGTGVVGDSDAGIAIQGTSNSGTAVSAQSTSGPAVLAQSTSGPSIHAVGSGSSPNQAAVFAEGGSGTSVYGLATGSGTGVYGQSTSGNGVRGRSDNGPGVYGQGNGSYGVYGTSDSSMAVYGFVQNNSPAVEGWNSGAGVGVYGGSINGTGVYGQASAGHYAGEFFGDAYVSGYLSKPGGGFKIDHPLDPANKFLSHSFVESADMKNVYDGVVILDEQGEAVVELPPWFEALNQEFRYQLTSIGVPGPNLYIAEEISNQRFKIAGGTPSMKVCWQVTGSRKDAWAQANQLIVEQEKSANERDHYLHPELYGHSLERSIAGVRHPEILRRFMEEQQQTPEGGRAEMPGGIDSGGHNP